MTQTDVSGPVLITGAAGGIGGAVAQLAAGAGLPVALLDRDETRLTAAADDLLRERPVERDAQVLAIRCDVGREDDVRAAFDSATERLGPPTMVATAAGIDRGGLVDALEPAVWDEVLAVNLRGTFLVCREAVRRMRPAGGGAIVCISSPLAFVATPGSAAYGASKAGVSALVRTLAVDHARDGIRVNALLPGPTETELMWASAVAEEIEELRKRIRTEVPLGRLADPAEIARAVLWLLSEDASYITGAQVACDGGVLAKASVSV